MAGCGDSYQLVENLTGQLPPNFNTSDLFDSKGQLHLSGLSQFSSGSESVNPQLEDTSASTDSTVHEEINLKPQCNRDSKCSGDTKEGQHEPSKDFSITELVEKQSASTKNDIQKEDDRQENQPFAQLSSDSFQGFVHMLPKGVQPPNPSQRFRPVSTSSPNRPVFVRAPNFRLASEKDKATADKPYGDLSEVELQNELKRIYELDRAEREVQDSASASKQQPTPNSVVRNLFPDSSKEHESKQQRPQQSVVPVIEGGGPRPYQPTLNDGLDELMNFYMHKYKQKPASEVEEVIEPKCVKAKGYVLGQGEEAEKKETNTKQRQYSPLTKSPKSRAVNLKELDQLWRDIQETKAKMDADIQNRLKQQQSENAIQLVKPVDSSSAPKKVVSPIKAGGSRKARHVGRRKGRGGKPTTGIQHQHKGSCCNSAGPSKSAVTSLSATTADDERSELATLLELSNLSESELLDDLLADDFGDYDLDAFDDGATDLENAGSVVDSIVEKELNIAMENVQLKEWLNSNPQHVAYYEKYLQEKYKKEFCENEISCLQRNLLDAKEQIASLTGFLDVKTKSAIKYEKLWETLIHKWKEHEGICSKKINALENSNQELKSSVQIQLKKTKEYEDELSKTVGLVEEFKERMEIMRREFEDELNEWKQKSGNVQRNLELTKDDLNTEKREKEFVQKSLDEARNSLSDLEITNETRKLQLEQAETRLKSNECEIQLLKMQNEEIKQEISKEKNEKQVLESKLRCELKDELRAEGTRLHSYYNEKMRSILKEQSDKMLAAENELISIQEEQIKKLQLEHKRKIAQLTANYEQQIDSIKQNCEGELTKLKKDSQEKGKLIANVAEQLAHFHCNPTKMPPPTMTNSDTLNANSVGQSNNLSLSSRSSNKKKNSVAVGKKSLVQILDTNSDMKSTLASFVNTYKDKNTA